MNIKGLNNFCDRLNENYNSIGLKLSLKKYENLVKLYNKDVIICIAKSDEVYFFMKGLEIYLRKPVDIGKEIIELMTNKPERLSKKKVENALKTLKESTNGMISINIIEMGNLYAFNSNISTSFRCNGTLKEIYYMIYGILKARVLK